MVRNICKLKFHHNITHHLEILIIINNFILISFTELLVLPLNLI
jgi:hypothetical protein